MEWHKKNSKKYIKFELIEGEHKTAAIKLRRKDLFESKAKAIIDDKKFILRTRGAWQPTIIVKSKAEGEIIASTVFDKQYVWKGILEINGQSFSWRLHNNPMATLDFYREDKDKPLLRYKLGVKDGISHIGMQVHESGKGLADKNMLVLIGLYMFLPYIVENEVGEISLA